MLKSVLYVSFLFAVIGIQFVQSYEKFDFDEGAFNGPVTDSPLDSREKYYKKKHYNDGEDKQYNKKKGKYFDHENEKHKKMYYDKDGEPDDSGFQFKKNMKQNKYQNHNAFDNYGKNKEVNYHDKTDYYEKEKPWKKQYKQELGEEVKPVSLHHDIDINFINPKTDDSNDAEYINVQHNFKNDRKKEEYVQISTKNNEKQTKDEFYKGLKEFDLTTIPSTNNSALMARFVMHNVDWAAIATISTNSKLKGVPFVNVISVSDGTAKKPSGVPFFYMTPKDFSSIDLNKDNRCTITATLAETGYCTEKNLDPESPLCARLILSGKIKKVKPGTEEEKFAKNALFSRHPEMESWPADHKWYFSKLKIRQIILIDHFGGATYVDLNDYFNVNNS